MVCHIALRTKILTPYVSLLSPSCVWMIRVVRIQNGIVGSGIGAPQ